jgi:hypothetical protein
MPGAIQMTESALRKVLAAIGVGVGAKPPVQQSPASAA